jgi:Zn-dependent protease
MYAVPSGSRRRRRRALTIHPIFIAILAVTAVGGALTWNGTFDSRETKFGVFLLVLGGWVITLCLHEFAHAYSAYRAGDRSVEDAGYLTLNPLKYANPFLSIVLPLVFIILGGIGLPGGAVYLHPHTFRTKWQRSVAAAVGPAVNVVFAVILLALVSAYAENSTHGAFWAGLGFLGFLQISAAVLNLLPIPGLDGYAIIEPYLAPETRRPLEAVKPWGMLGIFVLLQISQVNRAFFDFIQWLYDRSGATEAAWVFGRELFKFWQN